MGFQKFKTISYCVGQKHYSGTKNIVGQITFNKKTGKEIKLLVGQCSICGREKSMIVSNSTIQAEGLGDFFKNLREKGLNVSKKLAKNVLNNPTRAFDITANFASAAVSKNPNNELKTLPEKIKFLSYRQGPLPW